MTDDEEELYRKDPLTGEFVLVTPPGNDAPQRKPDQPEPSLAETWETQKLPFPPASDRVRSAADQPANSRSQSGGRRILRRTLIAIGVLFLALIALGAILSATSHKSTVSDTTATPTTVAAKPQPLPCSHFDLLSMPRRCLTPRVVARIKAAKAAERRRQAAARAQAQAEARRADAAIAAANAWHSGYYGPAGTNLDIYFKWIHAGCADYAVDGCWKIQVITENGCSYLGVTINELQGGAIVGNSLANQANVPPHTPVILELDADTSSSVTASAPTFDCY